MQLCIILYKHAWFSPSLTAVNIQTWLTATVHSLIENYVIYFIAAIVLCHCLKPLDSFNFSLDIPVVALKLR